MRWGKRNGDTPSRNGDTPAEAWVFLCGQECPRMGECPKLKNAGIINKGGEKMSTGLKFKPRILGFVCHW